MAQAHSRHSLFFLRVQRELGAGFYTDNDMARRGPGDSPRFGIRRLPTHERVAVGDSEQEVIDMAKRTIGP